MAPGPARAGPRRYRAPGWSSQGPRTVGAVGGSPGTRDRPPLRDHARNTQAPHEHRRRQHARRATTSSPPPSTPAPSTTAATKSTTPSATPTSAVSSSATRTPASTPAPTSTTPKVTPTPTTTPASTSPTSTTPTPTASSPPASTSPGSTNTSPSSGRDASRGHLHGPGRRHDVVHCAGPYRVGRDERTDRRLVAEVLRPEQSGDRGQPEPAETGRGPAPVGIDPDTGAARDTERPAPPGAGRSCVLPVRGDDLVPTDPQQEEHRVEVGHRQPGVRCGPRRRATR